MRPRFVPLRLSALVRMVGFALLSALILAPFFYQPARAQAQSVHVLTQHNDNARTGANLNETLLNASNVNVSGFGRIFSRAVDGQIYAQPLIVSSLPMPDGKNHNVVFVATEHNSVYAYDADDPNAAAPLWQVNLGPSVPVADVIVSDIDIEVGITSTPVIDLATQTLYVVAKTKENGSYFQRLHALDITTGAERANSPATLQATLPGTGWGSDGQGNTAYNPLKQNQRPALLLSQGVLYIASASHGDQGPYHGWVLAYDAATLTYVSAWNDTPAGGGGGIWQSGQGPAADDDGNVYVQTGNGSFNASFGGGDYSESFVKLNTLLGLTPVDYFAPYNQQDLTARDLDLGSTGPMLIPDTNLLVGGSKGGALYLLDRSNLGHFHAGDDSQSVQTIEDAFPGNLHGGPVYWNGPLGPQIYVWAEYDHMKSYRLTDGQFDVAPTAQSPTAVPDGMPGGFLSVSANGGQAGSGLIWGAMPFTGNANQGTVPGILRAFDASDVSHELWNTRQNAARDNYGNFAKFCPPTVANGKVYMATFSGQLAVYGLLNAAPVISPNGGLFGAPTTVTITDDTPGATVRYTLDGSDPTADSPLYDGPFTLYQQAVVKARAFRAQAQDSPVAQAAFVVDNGPGDGDGLAASYYKNTTLSGTPVTRIDPTVNFNWSGSPIAGVPASNFSARWTGFVVPRGTGTWTFTTVNDDGARLWVNGQQLINDWAGHAARTNNGTIALTGGQPVPITLEYFQGGGSAVIQLSWSSALIPQQIIPQSQLYSAQTYTISGTLDLQGSVSMALPVTIETRPAVGAVKTATIVPGADGSFSLLAFRPGAYDLAFKGAKWLRKTLPVTITNADITGVNAQLLAGDANNDNEVDLLDLSIIANSYALSQGDDAGFDPRADLNNDGSVDIADLLLLANNYGLEGDL